MNIRMDASIRHTRRFEASGDNPEAKDSGRWSTGDVSENPAKNKSKSVYSYCTHIDDIADKLPLLLQCYDIKNTEEPMKERLHWVSANEALLCPETLKQPTYPQITRLLLVQQEVGRMKKEASDR